MITLQNNSLCSGCGACASICPTQCIRMENDIEGFLYPKVNQEQCINCNKCNKVCPIINPHTKRSPLSCYAAYNTQSRMNSSSGGVFFLLAKAILEKKGVVCGVAFDETWVTEHVFIETIEQLAKLQGSKYIQSNTKETYKKAFDFLKQNRIVLYTGTPCQIAGLNSFLKQKKIDLTNLFTVELCCHGVPSPSIWKQYLSENVKGKITNITFRSKTNGWKNYTLEIKTNTGIAVNEGKLSNNYMKGFLYNLYCRPVCSNCHFKSFSTESDLSIGDFWGLSQFYPEKDDDKGMSLILPLTEKGNTLFQEIKKELNYFRISYNEVISGNTNFIKPSPYHPNRKKFWKMIKKGYSVDYCVSKCLQINLETKIKRFLKRIIIRWKKLD